MLDFKVNVFYIKIASLKHKWIYCLTILSIKSKGY